MTSAARDGAHRPPLMSRPGLVGREREITTLAEALSRPPALVLVEGEAGIGKSRLVREFLRSPAGRAHRSLVASCPPFREPCTLGPLVDGIRQVTDRVAGLRLSGLAGALRPLFPEWAQDLPPSPEPLEDATASRHRSYRALAELLDRLRVTVLVVEDAHWADEPTLEFLLHLTSRAAGRSDQPNLLMTCRPHDVPPASLLRRLMPRPGAGTTWLRMSPPPLGPDQTARMVSSMLGGGPVSADFADFLHRRTGGIPLVVEEAVRLMHDRADILRRGGEWVRRSLARIDVPPTVRDTLLERVGRLDADGRAVVRATAVLGEPSTRGTVAAVAGLTGEQADAPVAAAVGAGLLREHPRDLLSTTHALAGVAVYEAIPAGERRTLHRRAGRALGGTAPPSRLAHHFRLAGDTAGWRYHAERAAEAAIAAGDHASAGALLHGLVTEAELPAEAVVRLAHRIPLDGFSGRQQAREVVEAVRSALAGAPFTRREEAEARVLLGRLLFSIEEFALGSTQFTQAIPHLRRDSFEWLAALASLAWPVGDAPASAHLRWLRRVERVPDDALPPGVALSARYTRAVVMLQLGARDGWALAAQVPHDATGGGNRCRVAAANVGIGDAAMAWGHYGMAARRLDAALRISGDECPSLRAGALATQVHLWWFTGAWDGLLDRADALVDDEPHRSTGHEALLVGAMLRDARGDHEEARDRLRHVLDAASRQGMVFDLMEPAAVLAARALAVGDVDEALEVTEEAVGVVAGKGVWLWATELAPARAGALVRAGRIGEAAALVEAFARGQRGRDAPAPKAAVPLCRAILAEAGGEHARAAGLFARAAAAWQALPRPYDALLARERQARCLLAAGDTPAALAVLGEVLSGLSSLGARSGAARVSATLREHGRPARTDVRRGRRGYGDELSPRELDVVRLLVGGGTNQQIADVLVLSRQTVASHLHSAMRKLGVPTRTAVVVRALELGLVEPASPDAERAGAHARGN